MKKVAFFFIDKREITKIKKEIARKITREETKRD